MGGLQLNSNESRNDDSIQHYILLMKDRKTICRVRCLDAPVKMPSIWSIFDIVRRNTMESLSDLPHFFLFPASENSIQQKEWGLFLGFLLKNKKVAIAKTELSEFYICPPNESSNFSHAVVSYRMKKAHHACGSQRHGMSDIHAADSFLEPLKPVMDVNHTKGVVQSCKEYISTSIHREPGAALGGGATSKFHMVEEFLDGAAAYTRFNGSATTVDKNCPDHNFVGATENLHACELRNKSNDQCHGGPSEKNYIRAHPSLLRTLGQAHSSWSFGAIAELVDNSRDAKATKLEISVDIIYSKHAGLEIPMLSIIDDGHGMNHQEIVRMMSLGHEQPSTDDPDHIGSFGVGFKTGAMGLGKDALVLTQTANSRSIAFLSQSLNEGKDNLEIPIISYCRKGQFMEVDTDLQPKALAKYNLRAIKKFSPFNKYLIGEKASIFGEYGTGTQIYLWNLNKWGSDYCLQWETGVSGGSSFHQGDILIRSKRVRSRRGQTSHIVPLDYSLRSYLEVIFFDPRMKIYVQGSRVKSRPLAKSLSKTIVENGIIMGKPVCLTLGRCQLEWEQANCGIFLYWHGRLIEAYKRVGRMIHSADTGRGVIGVIDVTDLMDDGGNGHVLVHNSKQGFQDCEMYAQLEEWLGNKSDQYWFNYFETLQLKKGGALYKPDNEWVQCDKCRKWRMLSSDFDSKQLPQTWFCYMKPFNGDCAMPEEKVRHGVITVSEKRSGYDAKQNPISGKDAFHVKSSTISEGSSNDNSSQTVENDVESLVFKRLRRGPPRGCRKM